MYMNTNIVKGIIGIALVVILSLGIVVGVYIQRSVGVESYTHIVEAPANMEVYKYYPATGKFEGKPMRDDYTPEWKLIEINGVKYEIRERRLMNEK